MSMHGEDRLRALIEASTDVVYLMNADWTEMHHLIGRDFIADTREPITNWMDRYIPPSDHPLVTATIRAAIDRKTTFELEHRVYQKDGTIGWTHSRAVPVLGDDGQVQEWFGMATNITRRKAMEAELRESESRFRLLAENSTDMISRHAPDGTYLYASPASLRLLGYAPEELIGHAGYEFIDPLDHLSVNKSHTSILSGSTIQTVQFRGRKRDGETTWLETASRPILDPGTGAVLEIHCTTRDISERKQTEEKWAKTFKSAPMLMALSYFETGVFIDVNDHFCRVTGYSKDEVIGRSSVDMAYIQSDERRRLLEAMRPTGRVENFELTTWAKDGRPLRWLLSGEILELAGDRVLLSMAADVTEWRRAQEEAARSRDLLVNLAKLVPGVIYEYRLYPDGRSAFPYSSPGMELIYEVTPEEVQEDATPVFGRLHPDDYTSIANAIEASARTLETFYAEFRVILPRQGLRWRWSQARPQRMPDGSTLWHGIILDIHERKLAQLEMAELELRLQQAQKMESVGRLAGGVAHDFNNMLGVILGNMDVVLQLLPADSPLCHLIEMSRKAAVKSAELTRQLLAFARRQTISPKVLDVEEHVSALITMMRRLIGEAIHLDWRPEAAVWPVYMDPSQVDQILTNLCINARDAMEGHGQLAIEVGNISLDESACMGLSDSVPGDYIRLSVADNGCGMTPETMAHMFEPFFTTKGLGKGTGLGLATVYGIVKQNGGFVSVLSTVGIGTTVTVHLPRYTGPVGESSPTISGSSPQGQGTILVVEDEPLLLSTTTTLLEGLGYAVIAVGSAEDALRMAAERASEIRALLTDVVMPDMNGRDLATILTERYPHIATVFMSGYTADVISPHDLLDSRIIFLQKPFTKEALAFRLSEALATRPMPPIP